MSHPSPPPAARVVGAYDPAFRATMSIGPAEVETPEAVEGIARTMPAPARLLLDQLLIVVPPGDPLPERLRDRIARDGLPLWQAGLLLPRVYGGTEGGIHPQHYAGSCRLNPAAANVGLSQPLSEADARPSFAPADARWDAAVVAASLEQSPGQLTQDGSLRRDVEKRLCTQWGPDEARWGLALRLARATGLARAAAGRLHGLPEAHPRPITDLPSLVGDALGTAVAALVLRLCRDTWIAASDLLALLGGAGRETFFSPVAGGYPQHAEAFDDEGFDRVEAPAVARALDTLHRVGAIDAARDASGVTAFRRAPARPPGPGGFILTPNGEILVHVAEARREDYGRLCRLAPFVDGDSLRRHRLSREGVCAELTAGHRDTHEWIARHSRTGLAPNVADQVREWRRSATRITIVTGVDVLEDEQGKLRVAVPSDTGRVIDYTTRPRARFFSQGSRLVVPGGWDPLNLRATLARVGRYLGRDGDAHAYEPELRPHAAPATLLNRLREYHGGDLPGDVETLVLAGAGLHPVTGEDAVLVRLPHAVSSALRRDRIAGPLLRRGLGADECVVARSDLAALVTRLRQLGVEYEGPT
ncbi:MAG: hypothetical protein FJ090_04040 [Deltaproteobacteria bacterium]|nr:hypothetical protein [Deltaproteobacteria bacterium]